MTSREDEIYSKPPRLAPVAVVPEDMRDVVAPPPGYKGRAGDVPLMYGILLHNPSLLRKFKPLSSHFRTEGILPPRDRELAILRVAWLARIPFVWGEHVAIGKTLGITPEDTERVTKG